MGSDRLLMSVCYTQRNFRFVAWTIILLQAHCLRGNHRRGPSTRINQSIVALGWRPKRSEGCLPLL